VAQVLFRIRPEFIGAASATKKEVLASVPVLMFCCGRIYAHPADRVALRFRCCTQGFGGHEPRTSHDACSAGLVFFDCLCSILDSPLTHWGSLEPINIDINKGFPN
jgi:hypothetical protein